MAIKVDTDMVISWILALVFIVMWAWEESAGGADTWLRIMAFAMVLLPIEKAIRRRRMKSNKHFDDNRSHST